MSQVEWCGGAYYLYPWRFLNDVLGINNQYNLIFPNDFQVSSFLVFSKKHYSFYKTNKLAKWWIKRNGRIKIKNIDIQNE